MTANDMIQAWKVQETEEEKDACCRSFYEQTKQGLFEEKEFNDFYGYVVLSEIEF